MEADETRGRGDGVDIFPSALGCAIATQSPQNQRRFLESLTLHLEEILKTEPAAVSAFARRCMSRFRHALDVANQMSRMGRIH